MTGIPKGVLHRSDQMSNLAVESPPPIPPRNRNEFEENPTMAVVDLQLQDNYKYATHAIKSNNGEGVYYSLQCQCVI